MKHHVRVMRATVIMTATLALVVVSGSLRAQAPELISEQDFINGKMKIDFGTRKSVDTSGNFVEGSPAKDSKDVYDFQLNVAKTTDYNGKISRKPRLLSKILGREEQAAELIFDVQLGFRNPKNLEEKKNVGKLVGSVAVGADGVYDFANGGAGGNTLRMAVDAAGKAQAFTSPFGGRIQGKAAEKKGKVTDLISEYKRYVKGKEVKVEVKNADPLQFLNLQLAQGAAPIYPKTVVNGNLDYDYETGNWYTNGIRFKYTLNGVDYEDTITGSIKYVEDPARATNGKSQYEFNLRFNEEKNKPATAEGDAFAEGELGEDAFFAVDNTIPSMTGTIAYVDTMGPGGEEPPVFASDVTYNLHANKLTKQQAVNFFKLWLLIVGPTNDE